MRNITQQSLSSNGDSDKHDVFDKYFDDRHPTGSKDIKLIHEYRSAISRSAAKRVMADINPSPIRTNNLNKTV